MEINEDFEALDSRMNEPLMEAKTPRAGGSGEQRLLSCLPVPRA